MAGSRNFVLRMSAEEGQSLVQVLRDVGPASAQAEAALQRLVKASPQLAEASVKAREELKKTVEQFRQTGQQGGVGGGFSLGSMLGAGIGVGAGIFAVTGVISAVKNGITETAKAGDEAASAIVRLESALGGVGDASVVFSRLQAISRQTGVAIADTTGTFQRFLLAAKDLGVTNDQVLQLVGGIQKFGIVAGASGEALSAATTQLAQALASGKLQGDELRSIMEQMPELAAALAKELGTSMGALRQMGAEGKLTSDVVMPALLRAVSGIDEQFAKMPVSMARAQEQFSVSATAFLAHVDKAIGLSRTLSSLIQGAAEAADSLRQSLGGMSADETAAAAIAKMTSGQASVAAYNQAINDAIAAGAGQDDDAVKILRKNRDDIAGEVVKARQQLREINNRAVLQAEQEDEAAAERRLSALKAQFTAEHAEWRKKNDDKYRIEKDFNATMEMLNKGRNVGAITEADYQRDVALAIKSRDEELKKLAGTAKEVSTAVADALDKIRKKIAEDALSVEKDLDPAFRAWERYDDQIRKIRDGVDTGVLSRDRAKVLEGKALEQMVTGLDKVDQAATQTDRTFDQFFSNLSSKTEEAITNWKGFGNLAKSVADDIARVLLRQFVLNPAAAGAKGLFNSLLGWFQGAPAISSGSGLGSLGFSGASSAGFFALADGGVIGPRGKMPLNRYAGGGVARTPQFAMFGEGSTPEAYVPLPDGRSIPVTVRGGGNTVFHGGDIHIHVASSNASPALIAATARAAAREEQQRFINNIDRGGSMAKLTGRRRNR